MRVTKPVLKHKETYRRIREVCGRCSKIKKPYIWKISLLLLLYERKSIPNLEKQAVMAKKTLILNQDYTALTVCSVQKAFILVYLNKAELVIEAKDRMMRSVTSTYPMPSIIRLYKYVHLPYKGVMLNRQNIFKRDNHQCQYCGTHEDLTLDHVMPKSRGGKSSWDNLVTACRGCNSKKGDFTPEEARMPMRIKPFKPSFIMFLRDFSGNADAEWMQYLGKKTRSYSGE
jgi:hypothetical protein